mgnify:CR=1 FL=1
MWRALCFPEQGGRLVLGTLERIRDDEGNGGLGKAEKWIKIPLKVLEV